MHVIDGWICEDASVLKVLRAFEFLSQNLFFRPTLQHGKWTEVITEECQKKGYWGRPSLQPPLPIDGTGQRTDSEQGSQKDRSLGEKSANKS